MSEKCQDGYIYFYSISQAISNDGSRIERLEYSAEKIGSGYNLIMTTVGNNGKPDCEGLSVDTLKKNELQFFYVDLSESKNIMKLHFSEKFFYVYKKIK